MANLPDDLTPDISMTQVFTSGEARRGGVVKRKIHDVERLVGRDLFLDEAACCGFQFLENGQHFIICCNRLPIRPRR